LSNVSVLRDISLIILSAGAFVFTLIPLALFGVVVYGVWQLLRHRNLPTWLRKAREYVTLGLSYVELAMDAVTKPVFAVHGAFATVGGWISVLTKRGGV
jgi:hypothetical protein